MIVVHKDTLSHNFTGGAELAYERFLASCALDVTPDYWIGVLNWRPIETTGGSMRLVRYAENVDNPNYQPIAVCIINSERIFVWDDSAWAQATPTRRRGMASNKYAGFDGKTLILYRIGELKESDENGNG